MGNMRSQLEGDAAVSMVEMLTADVDTALAVIPETKLLEDEHPEFQRGYKTGVADVLENPGAHNLWTEEMVRENCSEAREEGRQQVLDDPDEYGLYGENRLEDEIQEAREELTCCTGELAETIIAECGVDHTNELQNYIMEMLDDYIRNHN